MKKRNYTLTTALTAALCCLICLLNGCTRDNDIDIPQTSINTMGATTVQPGETITLTGANMHLISKVYFGDATTIDVKTPQAERDHQSLTVYVPTEVFEETKVVPLAVLYNSVHRLVVCEELTVYIAPVIPTTSTTLSGEVKPGDIITITGTDLGIIKALQANGESITIDNKKATEITFKAPEVDTDTEFTITLVYDNSLGNDQKLVVPGKFTVKEVVPSGSVTNETQEVETGKDITIEGTNLNVVKVVRLTKAGGVLSDITITNPEATGFTFKAPEVEEDTEFTVTLIYGKSDKESASIGTVKVKTANALVYEWNVTIGGPSTTKSFFSGETGIHSACELSAYETDIDFLMNVGSSGNQFYDPSNTTNVLKNQLCDGVALNKDDYATFLLTSTKFRVLDSGNATQAELIRKVKEREITEITDELFTGISAPASRTPNNFAKGQVIWYKNFTKGKSGLIEILDVKTKEPITDNEIDIYVYFQK